MPTDTRDPVAEQLLAIVGSVPGDGTAEWTAEIAANLRLLWAEQGYVLVNAEGLAAALRLAGIFTDKHGPDEVAALLLAAIQEQQR